MMSHRKAFGPQRTMSPAIKARNVAASIKEHGLALSQETWRRYGLENNHAQQQLVRNALGQYQKQGARP